MGQYEVYCLLKEFKKPLSRTQIAEQLNENPNKISEILRNLLIHNEIKCIEISRIEAKKLLGDKAPFRRMKLYYLT